MELGCSKCGCLLTVLVGVALLAGRRVAHRGARSLVGVRSTGQERCDAAAGARAAPGRAAGHRQVGRRAYGIIEKRAVSERANERASTLRATAAAITQQSPPPPPPLHNHIKWRTEPSDGCSSRTWCARAPAENLGPDPGV